MGAIDITGERFGKLTVLGKSKMQDGNGLLWDCLCDCGNKKTVRGFNLRKGKTKSCGCIRKEKPNGEKHGMSNSRLYSVWSNMKTRCCNKNNRAYPRYGGRGIKVCDEWNNPESFIEWALDNGYSDKLTLDRIDNDGNYCPNNCRWVSMKDQENNTSRNVLIEFNGELKTFSQWCENFNLPYNTVHKRVFVLKWDFEKAIKTPIKEKYRNKLYKG